MTRQPSLFSQRLRLDRPGVYATDAESLLAYFETNKSHLQPWAPPQPLDYYTLGYWEDAVCKAQDNEAKDKGAGFLMRKAQTDGGCIIGVITLSEIVRGAFQACYLGYNLDHTQQGKGLMQEALQLTIGYAFDTLNLHRIMANYRPENARSAKTLEALGFKIEGTAENYLLIDGHWRDHVLTALTNPQWRNSSNA
ncbi:MAG: GNAT family N-acetyltransferase [Rhodospirillaceae bacterium]